MYKLAVILVLTSWAAHFGMGCGDGCTDVCIAPAGGGQQNSQLASEAGSLPAHHDCDGSGHSRGGHCVKCAVESAIEVVAPPESSLHGDACASEACCAPALTLAAAISLHRDDFSALRSHLAKCVLVI